MRKRSKIKSSATMPKCYNLIYSFSRLQRKWLTTWRLSTKQIFRRILESQAIKTMSSKNPVLRSSLQDTLHLSTLFSNYKSHVSKKKIVNFFSAWKIFHSVHRLDDCRIHQFAECKVSNSLHALCPKDSRWGYKRGILWIYWEVLKF